MTDHWNAEITLFEKHNGVLSKRLWLDAGGKVCNDGSACLMTQGSARRIEIADVHGYAALSQNCLGAAPNKKERTLLFFI
jgi:hypothetical protein